MISNDVIKLFSPLHTYFPIFIMPRSARWPHPIAGHGPYISIVASPVIKASFGALNIK